MGAIHRIRMQECQSFLLIVRDFDDGMDRPGVYAVAGRDKRYVTLPSAKGKSCGSVKEPLYEYKRIRWFYRKLVVHCDNVMLKLRNYLCSRGGFAFRSCTLKPATF